MEHRKKVTTKETDIVYYKGWNSSYINNKHFEKEKGYEDTTKNGYNLLKWSNWHYGAENPKIHKKNGLLTKTCICS